MLTIRNQPQDYFHFHEERQETLRHKWAGYYLDPSRFTLRGIEHLLDPIPLPVSRSQRLVGAILTHQRHSTDPVELARIAEELSKQSVQEAIGKGVQDAVEARKVHYHASPTKIAVPYRPDSLHRLLWMSYYRRQVRPVDLPTLRALNAKLVEEFCRGQRDQQP